MNWKKIKQFILNFLFIILFIDIVRIVITMTSERKEANSPPQYVEAIIIPGTEKQILSQKNDGLRRALAIPKVTRLIRAQIAYPSDSIKIKEFLLIERDSSSLKNDTYICKAYRKTPKMGKDTTFYNFKVDTKLIVSPMEKRMSSSSMEFYEVEMDIIRISKIETEENLQIHFP